MVSFIGGACPALDRPIAKLAIPALGSIAAEPLYNLADTAIVGHLGRSPLDALAIAASVLSGVAWLAIFLSPPRPPPRSRGTPRKGRIGRPRRRSGPRTRSRRSGAW